MSTINSIINFLKNININQLIDIGISVIIALIFSILSSLLSYGIIKLFNIKIKDKKKIKSNSFYKPLKLFFVFLGIYIALLMLELPENILFYITKSFKILTIFLISVGFANSFNSNSKIYSTISLKGTNKIVSFYSKIIRVFVYIVSGFIIITELGYNLGGLATGLGISSVVFALAAKDLAKNILAGLAILSDKPFELGDYIELDSYSGTVEDITFRSTRIRDINNQLVVLPNSIVIDNSLINSTKRKKRRYETRLTLDLKTSLYLVTTLTDNIIEYFNSNNNILSEGIRVFLDKISDNGIDIAISCYTDILEYDKFLKFKEEINYSLLSMLEKHHVELAYPSQSIYLKKE